MEVLPDHIRVLANLAERAEEIDLEKARAALKQANERLTMHDQADATDPAVALSESELARARVDAAELRQEILGRLPTAAKSRSQTFAAPSRLVRLT